MTTNANDPVAQELLTLERGALERWCHGDPSGFLEISAPDVVYFDPFVHCRVDGRKALSAYYDTVRGKIFAERFEILNPLVQRLGDMAALTFNFVSYGINLAELRWNCTEIYRREADNWQIVQTHWSFTAPKP